MQAQGLHRDGDDFMPNPPYKVHAVVPTFAQSLFALSEFTAESGATRFVPGSHVKDLDSKKIPPEDERRFICKPGACLVYDGRLMHGGAPNNTGEARYAVLNFHCRARMKPFCDHTRSIPRDIVEAASPTLRRLWGFECQSAWEESPRNYKIIEVTGAKPRFEYRGHRRGHGTGRKGDRMSTTNARDAALLRTVTASLPELAEIGDAGLRDKVARAWAWSLAHSSFNAIDEIPGSGVPDSPRMKRGTQLDHIRGVARLALAMGDEMKSRFPELPIDRDLLAACALCHDVGKPFEFDPTISGAGAPTPSPPACRRSATPLYGVHVCLTVGLPEEVCHAAGCHSGEGELVQRSLHVSIVHQADVVFWQTLTDGGAMEGSA